MKTYKAESSTKASPAAYLIAVLVVAFVLIVAYAVNTLTTIALYSRFQRALTLAEVENRSTDFFKEDPSLRYFLANHNVVSQDLLTLLAAADLAYCDSSRQLLRDRLILEPALTKTLNELYSQCIAQQTRLKELDINIERIHSRNSQMEVQYDTIREELANLLNVPKGGAGAARAFYDTSLLKDLPVLASFPLGITDEKTLERLLSEARDSDLKQSQEGNIIDPSLRLQNLRRQSLELHQGFNEVITESQVLEQQKSVVKGELGQTIKNIKHEIFGELNDRVKLDVPTFALKAYQRILQYFPPLT